MIAFLLSVAVAADPSLARLHAEDMRVATMSWRLATANAALCPSVVAVPGFSLHALSQYRPAQRAAAAAQFGLRNRVVVAAVAPESRAARAGLRAGDAILIVDGVSAGTTEAEAGYAPVARVEAMLESALAHPPVTLRVERVGSERDVQFTGDRGCASRVQIVGGKSINAQADGRYVQINTAMLDFVESDDELAVIVAHEMAHNFLRHRARNTPSKEAEYAADRLGVWLMARAGYDVDAVVPFWTRLERRTNAGIFADGTHPSVKKRLAAVSAAVEVLKAQRESGQELTPPAQ